MHQAQANTTSVLVADAARMLGFSVSAIREWRRMGILDGAQLGGRQAVTLTSIRELAAEFEAKRPMQRRRGGDARPEPDRRHLRLVVDNT